ncbi:MAG: O-antigen ligase family protein, partial [Oscillospiraceae bacterium]|nr:O-antigen ligase family protein [Oscillospiraceae bacterium]
MQPHTGAAVAPNRVKLRFAGRKAYLLVDGVRREPIGAYCLWLGIYLVSLILGAMHIGPLGSMLKVIAFIPIGIWLLTSHKFRLTTTIAWTGIYVLWIAMTWIWSINRGASFSRAVSQVSFFFLMASTTGFTFTEYELAFLKKCLIWSSRLTAVFVLIFASYFQGRMYLTGIVAEDPNYLCAYFLFAIIYAIQTILSHDTTRKRRILLVFELAVYAYIVMATGSRGGMFAIIAAIAVVVLFDRPRYGGGKMSTRIIVVIVLFAAAVLVAQFVNKDALTRFSAESIEESNGTGRYEIWESALNAFANSPFLRQLGGYGTQTARDITYLFPFPRHNVMHNMFVENLVEAGAIGVLFYTIHIFCYFRLAIRQRNFFSIAVIFGLFVLSLSTSIYTFKPYWNIMLYTLCCSRQVRSADPAGSAPTAGGV